MKKHLQVVLLGDPPRVPPGFLTRSLRLCSLIVDKIDGDGDGLVSEEELKQWIKLVQRRHVYDSVQQQWGDFDTDGDGRISWDEYKNVTYGSYLGKNRCSAPCSSPQ